MALPVVEPLTLYYSPQVGVELLIQGLTSDVRAQAQLHGSVIRAALAEPLELVVEMVFPLVPRPTGYEIWYYSYVPGGRQYVATLSPDGLELTCLTRRDPGDRYIQYELTRV